MNKEYLGDGVYVESDGFHTVLTVSNGITTTDTIYLDPSVFAALLHWKKQEEQREQSS